MIATLHAYPMIAFTSMLSLLTDYMGAPVMHVSRTYYPEKGYKILRPEVRRSFLEREFVYCNTVSDFLHLVELLEDSAHTHCVLLGDALPVLYEYSIQPRLDTALTVNHITSLATGPANYTGLAKRARRTAQAMLDADSKELILQKLYSLFYRIADKNRREQVRVEAFRYLTGLSKSYMHSGVPALDRHLESDLANRTRFLFQQLLATSMEEVLAAYEDADEFELGYLMSKHRELSRKG